VRKLPQSGKELDHELCIPQNVEDEWTVPSYTGHGRGLRGFSDNLTRTLGGEVDELGVRVG
jgi:hypothetical protein